MRVLSGSVLIHLWYVNVILRQCQVSRPTDDKKETVLDSVIVIYPTAGLSAQDTSQCRCLHGEYWGLAVAAGFRLADNDKMSRTGDSLPHCPGALSRIFHHEIGFSRTKEAYHTLSTSEWHLVRMSNPVN
jgi:hypothetical protein